MARDYEKLLSDLHDGQIETFEVTKVEFMDFQKVFMESNFRKKVIGKAKRGALIALTRQVIFLIPLILIFPLFLGIDGVMYAGPIADSAAVVVALALVTREMKRMPHVDEPVAADTLV